MNHPNLNPSEELAYILGVRYGDGCLHEGIELYAKDKEFVDYFSACASRVLGRKNLLSVYIHKDRGMYRVHACSRLLQRWLESPLEMHKEIIERFSASFLRGFYDSEGCICCYKGRESKPKIYIDVCNTDLSVLVYIENLLARHFLICTGKKWIYKAKPAVVGGSMRYFRKDVYHIRIMAKKSVQRFCNKIGFSIKRKQEKLEKAIQILDDPYECKVCGWKTTNPSAMGGHIVTNHPPILRDELGRIKT